MDDVLYKYEGKLFEFDGNSAGSKINVFQYEKINEHGLAENVIIEQVRNTGDIVAARQYYMTDDDASRINATTLHQVRNPDMLYRMYAKTIETPCSFSGCYGLCGRSACLNASGWK
jgi:hypothetical protein